MITEADFLAIFEARPEMRVALRKAIDAIVELRKEAAKNRSGLWAKFRLKRKSFSAVYLTENFVSGFVHFGHPASEENKELIRAWVVGAAETEIASSN